MRTVLEEMKIHGRKHNEHLNSHLTIEYTPFPKQDDIEEGSEEEASTGRRLKRKTAQQEEGSIERRLKRKKT